METEDGSERPCSPSVAELEDRLRRCQAVLHEIDQFKEHLRLRGLNHTGFSGQEFPGLGTHTRQLGQLHSTLRAAKQSLESKQDDGPQQPYAKGAVHHDTELRNYESRWNITKRCRGLSSMGAFVLRNPPAGSHGVMTISPSTMDKMLREKNMGMKEAMFIDAVADKGTKWLRIFTVSEKKLLDEMARSGYDIDPQSGNYEPRWLIEEDSAEDDWIAGDDDEKKTVLGEVHGLAQTAKRTCQDGRAQEIHIFLTRITSGQNSDIDKFIERLRRLGGDHVTVKVDCANTTDWLEPGPPLLDVLTTMIYDERDYLTPTLNLDQDIITELVSDLTNTVMEHKPWHVRHVSEQIDKDGPGSPRPLRDLWAILDSRKLVCTREAAEKFRHLLEIMGTEEEQMRGRLVLPEEGGAARPREETLDELQKLCIHPIPRDLQLPVQVVNDDYTARVEEAVELGRLPAVANAVAKVLGSRDGAIFLHGWLAGCTTVTCNRMTMKKINRVVSQNTRGEGGLGPRMWCPLGNTGNLARRDYKIPSRSVGDGPAPVTEVSVEPLENVAS